MSSSVSVSRKAEDAYPTDAPGPCSKFLVESKLLIYFYCFVYIILVILCSLLCVSVFNSWSDLFPRIVLFWFPLEPWFPWLLFNRLFDSCIGMEVTVFNMNIVISLNSALANIHLTQFATIKYTKYDKSSSHQRLSCVYNENCCVAFDWNRRSMTLTFMFLNL